MAAVDRGDTTDAVVIDAPVDDAAAVVAAEALVAAVATDDPASDAVGKFTKKEKEADAEPTIPKSRFDEQIAKERERADVAERRTAEVEATVGRVNADAGIKQLGVDLLELRKQERAAVLDNDEEKAAQLSAKADQLNQEIAIAKAGAYSAQGSAQATEDMRMEMTIERMEEKYPDLVIGAEKYNQDTVNDIIDKQTGYMTRERLSPSKALAKAVEYVMGRQVAPVVPDVKTGLAAAATGADRKGEAVARNLAVASQQPASMKDSGMDSDKAGQMRETPDAKALTFEEFEALPAATKSKMRGDFLVAA